MVYKHRMCLPRCVRCGRSFGGNLLVNRAFQLEPAAKASALNFSQARPEGHGWARVQGHSG